MQTPFLVDNQATLRETIAELRAAVARQSAQVRMVADIAAHVSSSLELPEVYRLVVAKLNEYFQVEAGSLLVRDPNTDELVFVMTLEGGTERIHGVRVPPGKGIAGAVAHSKQAEIIRDVPSDPRYYSRIADITGTQTRDLLCVPLVVKNETIGVIELINKIDGAFTEDDIARLTDIADIIGIAIENARLFEFVRQRRNTLEALVNRTVQEGLTSEQLVEALDRELRVQDTMLVVKFTNPYIVGQPVLRPEMCFGREPLLKWASSLLHTNSLLLSGERRIGKTTVLRQLQYRLTSMDDPVYTFRPVYIDLQGIEEPHFFSHLIEEILHTFGRWANDLKLHYFQSRNYGSRQFQLDLREIITSRYGPQDDGNVKRMVLLLDETDVMQGYNQRTLQEFRRIFMKDYAEYLSAVLCCVDVQRQWNRHESPLYNLFQQREITPLSRDDTEQLIRTPVLGSYTFDNGAVDMIYQLSGGRPMKVQLLCSESVTYLREQGRTNVTSDDVERVNTIIKGYNRWR